METPIREKRITPFGQFLFVVAVVVFTALSWGIMSWWAILVGPIIALLACRPAENGGPWIWEEYK